MGIIKKKIKRKPNQVDHCNGEYPNQVDHCNGEYPNQVDHCNGEYYVCTMLN